MLRSHNPPSPDPAVQALKRPLGRFLLVTGLVAVLGLAGAYYFVKSRFVNEALQVRLEAELSKALDTPVTVGTLAASWSGDIVFTDISFRLPTPPHAYDVLLERVEVNLDLTGLVLGRVQLEDSFESVALVNPRVAWVRGAGTAPSKGPPFRSPA